jgi:hypothetical protein
MNASVIVQCLCPEDLVRYTLRVQELIIFKRLEIQGH